jgi:hypothetical protein
MTNEQQQPEKPVGIPISQCRPFESTPSEEIVHEAFSKMHDVLGDEREPGLLLDLRNAPCLFSKTFSTLRYARKLASIVP